MFSFKPELGALYVWWRSTAARLVRRGRARVKRSDWRRGTDWDEADRSQGGVIGQIFLHL